MDCTLGVSKLMGEDHLCMDPDGPEGEKLRGRKHCGTSFTQKLIKRR